MTPTTRQHAGYELDSAPRRIDLDAAWAFLSRDAYWGRWRTPDDFRRQVENAWRVVGCYAPDGRMVGFARAWSDGVASAYLADVYVEPEHRGRGLGSAIVQVMVDDGPGRDFRWMLHTADAHGVYRRHGFADPDHTYLERPSRRSS
jgi:GNAT superfamily N-acetyltransferase